MPAVQPKIRAVVLAGGFAKRLWPLTLNKPKALLPLRGDCCIIDFIVQKLLEAEVGEIIVSTNRRFIGQFEEWLKRRRYPNVKFSVEESTREEEKPGAVSGLAALVRTLPEGDYLVLASDNVFSLDLREFANFFREKRAPVVAVYDVGDVELVKKYSAVKLDSDLRIVSFVEKPKRPDTTLVGTAIYAFPWRSLTRVADYLEEGGSKDSPGHFIAWLCAKEAVYGYPFSGLWFDVGDMESYSKAREAANSCLSWRGAS